MWVILKQLPNNWMPKHFSFVFFVSDVRKVCIYIRMFQILHSLQLKVHMNSLIYTSLMTGQGHEDQGCKAAYWKQVTSIIIRQFYREELEVLYSSSTIFAYRAGRHWGMCYFYIPLSFGVSAASVTENHCMGKHMEIDDTLQHKYFLIT